MSSLLVGEYSAVQRAKRDLIYMLLTGLMCVLIMVGILCGVYVVAVSEHIKHRASPYILEPGQMTELDADCILVLGAGVSEEGEPRLLLRDRLNTGVELYRMGVSGRLLMSGDHGRREYDEVNAMRLYAVKEHIPVEDIFMDHAGFSTYESMYRAKEIFHCTRIIAVTQTYHLYRAIANARAMGMYAVGISSDQRTYARQWYFDLREAAARVKDTVYGLAKPQPTCLGKSIPIFGNGNVTNDR